MWLLQWVTNTSVSCREDLIPLPLQLRPIQHHFHQLIHILHDQHITVELHDPIVFHQTERGQFRPAIVEARIIGIVLSRLGEQVLDALLGDPARFESGVAFGGKGVGVECNEGVFGVVLFEGEVESEEAGEVIGIGD